MRRYGAIEIRLTHKYTSLRQEKFENVCLVLFVISACSIFALAEFEILTKGLANSLLCLLGAAILIAKLSFSVCTGELGLKGAIVSRKETPYIFVFFYSLLTIGVFLLIFSFLRLL